MVVCVEARQGRRSQLMHIYLYMSERRRRHMLHSLYNRCGHQLILPGSPATVDPRAPGTALRLFFVFLDLAALHVMWMIAATAHAVGTHHS